MDSERALPWARLKDSARELAAVFDKRSLAGSDSGDAVRGNLADLAAAGIVTGAGEFRATLPENVELLRIIAGGCGPTAFAVAAALTAEHPPTSRQQCGNYYSAAVLLGLAERAYELAVQDTKDRSSTTSAGPARLPGTQFAVARMRAGLATSTALLTRYATRWTGPGDDPAGSVADSFVPRYYLAAEAEHVVSTAYEVIGVDQDTEGAQRVGQIWRDIKTGSVPPFSNDLARELIGKAALGIDPSDTPRWL